MDYLIENGHAYRTGNTKTGTFKIYKAPEKRLEIKDVDGNLEILCKNYLGEVLPLPKGIVTKVNDTVKSLKDISIAVAKGERKEITVSCEGYASSTLVFEDVITLPTLEERMTSLEAKIDLLLQQKTKI